MRNIDSWKCFLLSDIFDYFETGKVAQAGLLEDGDDIWYLGAKKDNNGLMNKVAMNNKLLSKGNCVVFICDGQGSVGYANYMDKDFLGTVNLTLGYGKYINKYTGLFIATVASLERYRYSYGRKWRGKVRSTSIKLPVDKNGVPDWTYMEDYMRSFPVKFPEKIYSTTNFKSTVRTTWKEFYLHKLFEITMGNGIDANKTTSDNPKYNYVSRDSNGNGVVACIDEIPGEKPFPAGAMSLALGGSFLGSCFIQTKPFYTAQNIGVLKERIPISNAVKLFIATLIREESKVKYRAFGRELNTHFRKDFTIKLPVKQNENGVVIDEKSHFSQKGYIPDWQYMEDYMKSLPYGDCI